MKQSRLFRILYALLERGQVSAPQLAAQFEVSVRTIYRDIDALSAAGVPVYALPGRRGGFALLGEQVLSRSILSGDEQEHILLALKSLPPAAADSELLTKLSALFGHPPADWITVDLTRWGGGDESRFSLFKNAILTRRTLSFRYAAAGQFPRLRTVLPARLAYKGQAWYLQGWCTERNAFRTFKLSRITDVCETGESFAPLPAPPPIEPDAANCTSLCRITLRFAPEAAFRVYDEFTHDQISPQPDGSFVVQAAFPADGWLDGYLLSFGAAVEIISPQEVRERLASLAFGTFLRHTKT
ncbi:MAG: helix-turn-helix transcriptional regulator [Butyricicoccus sp.]